MTTIQSILEELQYSANTTQGLSITQIAQAEKAIQAVVLEARMDELETHVKDDYRVKGTWIEKAIDHRVDELQSQRKKLGDKS